MYISNKRARYWRDLLRDRFVFQKYDISGYLGKNVSNWPWNDYSRAGAGFNR
ncbi:hypothetical protein EcCFBP13530_06110 [Enterobacter cancerogenus]|uniref:DUF1087 domain-containing protein n=1 Tax=Enterobacter cancerogenus TaxID=69218 RepID=A0AB38PA70_9ENTR|nr:hypothetical protein EcCFBP13530_06110 [Enterobacter cancerogenus]